MNKVIYPRVLIISHNPLSDTQSNGKTLTSFFKQWDTEKIAQVYLTTDVPDFSTCNIFFQLNDFDILKRFFFKRHIQGRKVIATDTTKLTALKKNATNGFFVKILKNNFSPILNVLRELLWSLAGFNTSKLQDFVNDFDPQVIFLQSSNATFTFKLTKQICQKYGVPLIIQITGDYITPKFKIDPFYWIQHYRLKGSYKWAFSYSDHVVAICDKMVKEYKPVFGGNYFVAMNSIELLNMPEYIPSNNKIKFLFAGNIVLKRWKTLALIGECLKELSIEDGLNGELSIYSLLEPGSKELQNMNQPPFSYFKGAINTQELNEVKTHSDVLVHVEAFDKKNKFITRLSISTKIPEYLASGRCVFAVGPNEVASMQYLIENDLGVTVVSEDKNKIKEALKEIMTDVNKRIYYAEKGKKFAKSQHNAAQIRESIFQIIKGVESNN